MIELYFREGGNRQKDHLYISNKDLTQIISYVSDYIKMSSSTLNCSRSSCGSSHAALCLCLCQRARLQTQLVLSFQLCAGLECRVWCADGAGAYRRGVATRAGGGGPAPPTGCPVPELFVNALSTPGACCCFFFSDACCGGA